MPQMIAFCDRLVREHRHRSKQLQRSSSLPSFVINDNTFKVNEELKFNKLFLYGSLKEDFATLAKEYVNAVHVSATQELHRIIMRQQEKINELEAKINMLMEHLNLS